MIECNCLLTIVEEKSLYIKVSDHSLLYILSTSCSSFPLSSKAISTRSFSTFIIYSTRLNSCFLASFRSLRLISPNLNSSFFASAISLSRLLASSLTIADLTLYWCLAASNF